MTATTNGVADRYDFWTGNKALISNANQEIAESAVTSTELSYMVGVTSGIQTQINGKQDAMSKYVFSTPAYSTAPGWVKLGTFDLPVEGSSRWNVQITGKQGWDDQNYPGWALLHGSSNFISTDSGQIAAGCAWTESPGTGIVATSIALVRQAGYARTKFDLFILLNSAYVSWLIEVTVDSVAGRWTTDIQSAQTNPGAGTNVFYPTRKVMMLDANYSDLVAIEALAGTSGFLKKTAASTWSLDTSTYLTGNQTITLSGVVTGSGTTAITTAIADGALSIAKTSGLQTALDGKLGTGLAVLLSPTAYQAVATYALGVGGGFRATGYDASGFTNNGPGVEVHYDSANTRARILGYNRTSAARIELAVDGSPINFYANGTLKGAFSSAGDFSLVNLTASRALVSDGSKNVVASDVTSTELGYLSGVTSSVQTQINGKYRDFGQLTGTVDYNSIASGARGIASIFGSTVSNNPPGTSANQGQGALWQDYGANAADWRTQLFVNAQSDYLQFRTMTSTATWRSWHTVWHDGNFNPSTKVNTNPWNSQAIAIAAAANNYFNGSNVGDLCVRFGDSTKAVLLGVFDGASGTNNASIWYNKTGAGAGGTFAVTGTSTYAASLTVSDNIYFANPANGTYRGIQGTMGANDYWRIMGRADADNGGYLEIATADDGTEPIYVRQYSSGVFGTLARTATLLDASGNTNFPGVVLTSYYNGVNANYVGNWTASGYFGFGGNGDASQIVRVMVCNATGVFSSYAAFSCDLLYTNNNGNGTNVKIGDDCWIGDVNTANTIKISGVQNSGLGYLKFGSDTNVFGYNGTRLDYGGTLGAYTLTGNTLSVNYINAFSLTTTSSDVTITTAIVTDLSTASMKYPVNDITTSSTLGSYALYVVNSASDLTLTLPSPTAGRSIKVAVQNSGSVGHRVYPASGHVIYWSGMYGTSYNTFNAQPSGVSSGQACLIRPGLYEFVGVSSTEWVLSSTSKMYS